MNFKKSVLLITALSLLASSAVCDAATFHVTKTADTVDGFCDADCSLREAIIAANADVAADTIIVPAGVYTLSIAGTGENAAATGDLDVAATLTISGAGADSTIIDGGGIDRVFDLHNLSGAGVVVTMSGVMIRKGQEIGSGHGGGIQINDANPPPSLTLLNSTVTENSTDGLGGGIFSNSGSRVVVLRNVTLSQNTAVLGGGGIAALGGSTSLENCTLSGNEAGGHGGGIYAETLVDLNSVTIAGNTADNDGASGGDGGGIFLFTGGGSAAILKNTIVAGNLDGSPLAESPDCKNTSGMTSLGHNFIGKSDGCSAFVNGVNADLAGTIASPIDPLLGPLQNNGGVTQTHLLLAGSPAMDAGDNANCPSTDQRGFARPLGSACDIGAVEVGCGNAFVELAEACDDGNADNADSCLDTCVEASCGDGFVQTGLEECDGGEGCTGNCTVVTSDPESEPGPAPDPAPTPDPGSTDSPASDPVSDEPAQDPPSDATVSTVPASGGCSLIRS